MRRDKGAFERQKYHNAALGPQKMADLLGHL
jgi:hypothetical protein